MEFKIDYRERQLLDLLKKDNVNVLSLDVGDILISNKNDEIVIERKTVQDFCQSIKDGRYHEQKARLLSNYSPSSIHYIVEGHFDFRDEHVIIFGLNHAILVSSFINTIFRDNINIIFTKDVFETASFIDSLINRMVKYPEKYFEKSKERSNDETINSYINKPKKSENITKKDVFLVQLASIPGVSLQIARKLSEHCQIENMTGLVKKINSFEKRSDAIIFLISIKGIGKILAEKILDVL